MGESRCLQMVIQKLYQITNSYKTINYVFIKNLIKINMRRFFHFEKIANQRIIILPLYVFPSSPTALTK